MLTPIRRLGSRLSSKLGIRLGNPTRLTKLALPGPNGNEVKARAEYLDAQENLGIQVEEGPHRAAMIAGAPRKKLAGIPWRSGDKIWRSIVVHQRPFDLREIFRHLSEPKSFSMLVRSVPKDFGPFERMIDKAKEGRNKVYTDFLDGPITEWVMPRKFPVFGRDAIIWADSADIIPRQSLSERTAALDGTIVPQTRAGSVINSVLNRTSLPFDWNRLDQLTFAAPANVIWGRKPLGFYAIGNKAYAFWVGVPNYNRLNELLGLDLDIYLHLELEEDLVYAKVIVRAESDFSEWNMPEFGPLEEQLLKLGGTWKRVGGLDVQEAFRFFVPGSAPPKTTPLVNEWKRHSLPHLKHQMPRPNQVLLQLTSRVRQSDDVGGNVMVGKYDNSFFLRSDNKHTWLFTAQTETGKTTLATYCALQQTNFVLSLQLTHMTEEEAVMSWAPNFGGQVRLWDGLEDADTPEEELELLKQDSVRAQQEADELFDSWRREGWPEMPLGIYTNSESVRYINRVHAFTMRFIELWKPWWKETGWKCVILLDDWVSIPSGLGDPYLGDVPEHVGASFRKRIKWLANNCRKFGVVLMGTAHTAEEVGDGGLFPVGTLSSFNVHCELREDSYKIDIFDPGRRALIAPNLETRLPRNITRVVGR